MSRSTTGSRLLPRLAIGTAAVGLALLTFLVIYVPWVATQPAENPLTTTPADEGLAYRDITLTIPEENLALQAWYIPATTPKAVLVFLHGAGSHRHSTFFDSLSFYKDMVALGYSVFAPDLRNHGDSDRDGNGISFGLHESADAAAALAWVHHNTQETPVIVMGISMGGATAIHALAGGAKADALVLLDPLLDTDSAFVRGVWTATGLPPGLFAISAVSARHLFGLPSGKKQSSGKAEQLTLPTLLIQDPQDPVTLAEHARALAAGNDHITLWEAPPAEGDHPLLVWRGRWGSHVAAYTLFPEQVLSVIDDFATGVLPAPKG